MEKVKRFEDLVVWSESRILCKEIHALFKEKKRFSEIPISNQIIRSSGSIMDNIAEGFERGGNKELLQYLWISKASAGECRSQLYRAFDCDLINEGEFLALKRNVEKLSVGIYRLINHIRSSNMQGQKYIGR